jgi:hypothetical protein
MVNKMSGKPEKIRSFSLERDSITLNGESLASALNKFYVSVNSDIPPLNKDSLPVFLPSRNDIRIIQPYEVCNHSLCTSNPQINRSRQNSMLNSERVCFCSSRTNRHHFNKSLSSSVVPKIWKEDEIMPTQVAMFPFLRSNIH